MSFKKQALFVSHEASATGAPVFYLELIKQFKEHHLSDFDIDIVIIKDGILKNEFLKLGRVFVLDRDSSESAQTESLLGFLGSTKYEFSYYNTLESAHLLAWMKKYRTDIPTHIFHIHELEGTIERYGGSDKIQSINQLSDCIITVSLPVFKNLVDRHGFDRTKMAVIPPFTRVLKYWSRDKIEKWKETKGLSGRKVVLGCGDVSAGKGVDFFVRSALESAYRERSSSINPRTFFMWLGPDTKKEQIFFEKEIVLKGMEDSIKFCGFDFDVEPYFNACDVFLMCSREDSHPLVCLEAASLKKPVIFFEESGGIGSFFKDKGFKALFLDIESTLDTINLVLKGGSLVTENIEAVYENYIKNYGPQTTYFQIVRELSTKLPGSVFSTF